MRLNVCLLTSMALLLSMIGSPCAADEKVARTDSNGDPLPARAIARLGASRLQHGSRVFTLAYSQDGKWLASAGADGIIRLWDAATGKASLSLEGHKNGVHNLVFVQPGEGKPATVLDSASWDRTVRFWDLKTGKEFAGVTNHPGTETVLAVSPDGKLLASAGTKESRIFIWRVEDGKEIRRWKAHQGGVTALAFAPDGKSIASGGVAQPDSASPQADEPNDDYGIAVWETETGKPRRTFTGHPPKVRWIAFSPDGKLHAFCGGKGRSMLSWDPESGKQLRAVGDRVNLDDALSLALTRDCSTLAAGTFNHSIRLFDTETGAEQRRMETEIMGRAYGLAISPDGLTLAAAGDDGRIRLWDMSRGTAKSPVPGHGEPLNSVAVSPDGKTIVTTSYGEPARLWDRVTGRLIRQLEDQKMPNPQGIWCAAFSPNSRTVALAHQRQGISLWDVDNGNLQRRFPERGSDRLVSLAFSSDGKLLASESIDQPFASLWDASTGELKRTFQRGTERSRSGGTSVAISPDNRLLASAASNGLNVWHLDSGKLAFLNSDTKGSSVAFSPGGILVAIVGRDVRVVDAFAGKELAKFDAQVAHGGSRGIAFSPDGRLLGVAGAKHVQLWDVANRRELPKLEGHQDVITSVAFTPDGKSLVSASKDCTALIWDLGSVLPPAKEGNAKVQWSDLQDGDRLRVYAAYCRLRASPDHALTLLKTNLKPVPAAPPERLAELITKLDNDSFEVREQATRDLRSLGLAAEKSLREAAKNNPSPETAKRVNRLLADLDTSADWLRTLAALKLAEELPPTTVQELLQRLSEEDPESRLAKEAKVVLQRVLKRGPEQKP